MQATKLRIMLITRGYPQNVVADNLGVPDTRISEWARGVKTIPNKYIVGLCEILRCNPDDILGVVEFDELQKV